MLSIELKLCELLPIISASRLAVEQVWPGGDVPCTGNRRRRYTGELEVSYRCLQVGRWYLYQPASQATGTSYKHVTPARRRRPGDLRSANVACRASGTCLETLFSLNLQHACWPWLLATSCHERGCEGWAGITGLCSPVTDNVYLIISYTCHETIVFLYNKWWLYR